MKLTTRALKGAAVFLAMGFSGALLRLQEPAAMLVSERPWPGQQPIHSSLSLTGNVWLLAHRQGAAGRLPVYKNRTFCGPSVPDERLLTTKKGGVRNAVVLLHSIDRFASGQPGRVVLDNIKCAFAPHVQVATVGSELLLKNSDPILHTVHARLGPQTLFNVGLPKGRETTTILEKPGVVRIHCDVLHTWMSAAVVVTTTPYFAITNERGFFLMDNLPPGEYRMEVWHESLGRRLRTISLGQGSRLSLDVVFASATGNSVE
jgi:plastocyanin